MRVAVITGLSGVGKTSVARAIGARLQCRWAGVGDFLRARAKEELGRETAAEFADALRTSVGTLGLFEAFVNWVGVAQDSDLIVEGVRTVEGLESLQILLRPTSLQIVELVAPTSVRQERLRKREASEGRSYEQTVEHCIGLPSNHPLSPSLVVIDATPAVDQVAAAVAQSLTWSND